MAHAGIWIVLSAAGVVVIKEAGYPTWYSVTDNSTLLIFYWDQFGIVSYESGAKKFTIVTKTSAFEQYLSFNGQTGLIECVNGGQYFKFILLK